MDAQAKALGAKGQDLESQARAFNDVAQGLKAVSEANAANMTGKADAVEAILYGLAEAHKAKNPPKPAKTGT